MAEVFLKNLALLDWTCEQVKTLKLKLTLGIKGRPTSLVCYVYCDTKI